MCPTVMAGWAWMPVDNGTCATMPPKPSGDFTAFLHRSNFDLVMFGYVQGMRRALPGLTLERIMEQFLAELIRDESTLSSIRERVGLPPSF